MAWRVPEGRSLNSEYLGEYDNYGSLPKILGRFGIFGQWQTMLNEYSGAFTYETLSAKSGSAGSYDNIRVGNFDASRCSGTYWRTDGEVHARNLGVYYLIKYI